MKNLVRLAAVAAALTLAAPAAAQQRTQPRVGLGLAMPNNAISDLFGIITGGGTVLAPQIVVPIIVNPNIRIEPLFGYASFNDDEEDVTDSTFTLGVGGLYVVPVVTQTQLYFGARLASTWTKDEERISATAISKSTARNTSLAAVFGGEYLPSPWFSVGAEAQLQYTSLGDVETETPLGTVETEGGSIKSTQGLFFMRVYFM